MNAFSVSSRKVLPATCVNCEMLRNFQMASGDEESLTVTYECPECSHTLRLDLDP